MKKSKENEHRISNLKDMLNNVKDKDINKEVFDENEDEYEEDEELLNYLHSNDKEYEINDEFIYHPDSTSENLNDSEINDEFIYNPNDDSRGINLETQGIDENYIIKTKLDDSEFSEDDVEGEISESFDNLVNAKIAGTPIIGIASLCIGALLLIGSVILFATATDRIVDNVSSGERSSVVVFLIILGILLIIVGAYKIFGFQHLNKLSKSIKNVEKEKENKTFEKPTSKEIPQAKERPEEKKGLSQKEIEELEYEKASLDNESIDEIFSNVDDSIKKE